jgi:Plant mobile domain
MLFMQFEAMDPLAGAHSVSRCLEAFLFWLLGGVLLINSRGHCFDRVLIPYVRAIVDAPDDDHVPRWAWGPAVLAATYRGLCDACVSGAAVEPKLKGCPLLLQLWAYERIAVGRPLVAPAPYPEAWYGELEDDRPTMGTHWVLRPVRFSN